MRCLPALDESVVVRGLRLVSVIELYSGANLVSDQHLEASIRSYLLINTALVGNNQVSFE